MKNILTIKNYLILANVILVTVLIILSNLKILPLQNIGDFGFFVGIAFLLAMYRPGWSFLFFVGVIVLENINLAPSEIGLALRPFQLVGFLTLLAVGIRYFTGRLGFALPKFSKADILIAIFLLSGLFSSFFALNKSNAFKQSLIIISFGALYFLTRIFIQNLSDIKRVMPFFLSSSAVVILYGIWQNWRFTHGGAHFEVMPGRPNATFAEPDWLGMFLVFLLSAVYALIAEQWNKKELQKRRKIKLVPISFLRQREFSISEYRVSVIFRRLLIVLIFTLLLLTVSRSAWLGAIIVSLVFGGYGFWKKKYRIIPGLLVSLLLSVLIIYVFNLTNFELGKRLQSTGGKQEITVACKNNNKQQIANNDREWKVEELQQVGCWHINLEEIENEKARGNYVTKVYRADPNVNIRAEIYKKSWEQIKAHPIAGIGWGNISRILGTDENGNGLNSSNIFLEIWLGSGLLGVLVFVLILLSIVYDIFKTKNEIWKLFLTLSFLAIIVPNLFNAGIMLGFLWVWLGVAGVVNNDQ